jgi:CelD/BcsL family acetyltransferase involved in cellulose biosynthesis
VSGVVEGGMRMGEGTAGRPAAVAELITEAARLTAIEDRWRELCAVEGVPFTTPEWVRAWLAHNPSSRPVVGVVREGDEIVGVMPFVLSRRGGLRVLHMAGDDLADSFAPLCADPADAARVADAVARAIAAHGPRWDMIALAHVDVAAGWHGALMRALPWRVTAIERRRLECPEIAAGGDTWDEYMAGRRRTVRKETRRRRRRLEEDESHRFHPATAQEASAASATLFRLHDMRWDDRGGSSIDSGRARRFLTDFNVAAARRGWLQLWQLDLDGAPAAAELAWRIADRQTHFQGGFDPAHASRGLGIVLFARVLEDGFRDGVRTIDMGQGTAAYKMEFATGSRRATTLWIVRSRHPARAALSAAMLARRAIKALPAERVDAVRGRAEALRDRATGLWARARRGGDG